MHTPTHTRPPRQVPGASTVAQRVRLVAGVPIPYAETVSTVTAAVEREIITRYSTSAVNNAQPNVTFYTGVRACVRAFAAVGSR